MLTWLTCHAGITAIHGPMIEGRLAKGVEGYDEASFQAVLQGRAAGLEMRPEPLATLYEGGAEGPLYGGTRRIYIAPTDEEARERRSARLRRLATRLATVATVVLVVYGVFPVRTWIDQEAASDRARERREVFERENELLADEVRDLGREERIEEEARAMGMVLPGEESYGIMPAPETPASTTSTTESTESTG